MCFFPKQNFKTQLAGGCYPSEKKLVKLDHLPPKGGEHKKYMKPPPSQASLSSLPPTWQQLDPIVDSRCPPVESLGESGPTEGGLVGPHGDPGYRGERP